MEMITQQAICERVGNRIDVLEVQVHEMFVIAFLDEDILTIVAAIVDVVIGVVV